MRGRLSGGGQGWSVTDRHDRQLGLCAGEAEPQVMIVPAKHRPARQSVEDRGETGIVQRQRAVMRRGEGGSP